MFFFLLFFCFTTIFNWGFNLLMIHLIHCHNSMQYNSIDNARYRMYGFLFSKIFLTNRSTNDTKNWTKIIKNSSINYVQTTDNWQKTHRSALKLIQRLIAWFLSKTVAVICLPAACLFERYAFVCALSLFLALPYCHRLSVRFHAFSCMCLCVMHSYTVYMVNHAIFYGCIWELLVYVCTQFYLSLVRSHSELSFRSFTPLTWNMNDNSFQYMNPTIHFSPQTKCLILFDNVETVLYLSAPFLIQIVRMDPVVFI